MKLCRALLSCVFVASLLGSPSAFADDAIQTAVTSVSPSAIVTPNGQGSYSPGQIEILYTVIAPSFTAGNFGSFTLNLQDIQKSTKGQFPSYPVNVSFTQTGSAQVVLTPGQSSLPVSGEGWNGSTAVTIAIPDSVAGDPANAVDGTTLVGNLNVSSDDPHLGTNTSVQVKIRLAVPKGTACLNVYHFETDEDFTQILSGVAVNVNKKNVVVATNPGQLSDNTLVVNTCAQPQSFDVQEILDPRWSTNPSNSNNAGNAVFTFNPGGPIDDSQFNIASFGTGTAQGQSLCIQNVTVAAGDTFLMTVHMGINNGMSATTLGTSPFSFSAGLYQAKSACNTNQVDTLASPNPATSPLPFTTF